MPTRFMTDPHQMRAMAGRFEMHAQTVEDEARRMWASSMNIAGADWSGQAQATSYDTMGQVNQAFRNMVGPDREARFVLVVLTQAETDSPVRRVEVEIMPPTDDESLVIGYELPDAAVGGEMGFAFFNVEVELPVNGRWVFLVTGGAGTFSLPLQVVG